MKGPLHFTVRFNQILRQSYRSIWTVTEYTDSLRYNAMYYLQWEYCNHVIHITEYLLTYGMIIYCCLHLYNVNIAYNNNLLYTILINKRTYNDHLRN